MSEAPDINLSRDTVPGGKNVFRERVLGNPTRAILGAYAALIMAGTLALMLPACSAEGRGLPFVDALFTATSAVCVTGLTVVDTGTHFSGLGKFVILALIQIGGLGIMTAAAFVAMAVGKTLQIRQFRLVSEAAGGLDMPSLLGAVKAIFLVAFTAEALAALLLFGQFLSMGHAPLPAFASSVFHAVSAFCNAGFSLYPDSFARFAAHPAMLLTIAAAAFCGSLGFVVFLELWETARRRWRGGLQRVLSLQTKLALATSGLLLAGGTLFFWAFEFHRHTMDGLTVPQQISASLFTSVMARTTGFNVLPTDALSAATLFMLMVLMFIGGSPLSTAGGIKTTTFAVLHLAFRSIVTRDTMVHAFHRRISAGTVRQALAIAFTSIGLLVMGGMLLLWLEAEKSYLPVFFEAVSAMNTVGLSMGVTSQMSEPSKYILAGMMFAGRVGFLTVVLAVAGGQARGAVVYPKDQIMVG